MRSLTARTFFDWQLLGTRPQPEPPSVRPLRESAVYGRSQGRPLQPRVSGAKSYCTILFEVVLIDATNCEFFGLNTKSTWCNLDVRLYLLYALWTVEWIPTRFWGSVEKECCKATSYTVSRLRSFFE